MFKRCAFCNKKIKGMPASSIDKSLLFCDIICAKLYYDNIERFAFNRREYNSFYVNDQLSNTANEIFTHVGGIMFELLPYVYIETNDEGSDDEADEGMRNDFTIESQRQQSALDSSLEYIIESQRQHPVLESQRQHPALESQCQRHTLESQCQRHTLESQCQHPALDPTLEHIIDSQCQHTAHPSAPHFALNAHTQSTNSRACSLSISSRRSAKTKYIKGLTPLLFNA